MGSFEAALCALVAVDSANRAGKITRARWGQISWEVWPGDTVERGVHRFHAAARELRLQQAREKNDAE